MRDFRLAVAVAACATLAACESTPGADERHPRGTLQTELLVLPVADGEVVMANRQAPVDIESPCIVPVIQGIGRYADVGWVSPRFFAVSSPNAPHGYQLDELPSGRARLSAHFRVPRSEAEAVAFHSHRERGGSPVLFCEISGTLQRLNGTAVKRLASWPFASVSAQIRFGGQKRELALDISPDWTAGGEVIASIDLSADDRRRLERDLQSEFGAQVDFIVSTQWRRTGCFQRIDLGGIVPIEAFGLKDGQRGAVSLGVMRLAVRKLVGQSTNVSVDGECGEDSIVLPPPGPNAEKSVLCDRSGKSLNCTFEGQFSDAGLNFQTSESIGERIAGVF
jgi:hypothetical protein